MALRSFKDLSCNWKKFLKRYCFWGSRSGNAMLSDDTGIPFKWTQASGRAGGLCYLSITKGSPQFCSVLIWNDILAGNCDNLCLGNGIPWISLICCTRLQTSAVHITISEEDHLWRTMFMFTLLHHGRLGRPVSQLDRSAVCRLDGFMRWYWRVTRTRLNGLYKNSLFGDEGGRDEWQTM